MRIRRKWRKRTKHENEKKRKTRTTNEE